MSAPNLVANNGESSSSRPIAAAAADSHGLQQSNGGDENHVISVMDDTPSLVRPSSNDGGGDLKLKIKLESMDKETRRIFESKKRHEEDVRKHHLEPARPLRLEDDWQVPYVWSFIVKFNIRSKITRLETLEDFERCLTEPVANRPDDVLEGILICFLSNLKPGLRNLTCENIQSQLSNYVTEVLTNTSEWTVWDRDWPTTEQDRAGCCSTDPHRDELGKLRHYGEPKNARAKNNPLVKVEEKGGGLFELDWVERVRLLRQMVDWQLTHSESIRSIVNREYGVVEGKGKKSAEPVSNTESIVIPTLGLTRDRGRIWGFDDSWRLWKSGNPFKRPCPMFTIVSTKEEYLSYVEDIEKFGGQSITTSNGKPDRSRLAKSIQEERALAAKLRERIPVIEIDELRVQKARRKTAQTVQLHQLAELRSTRTRRQSRKVDYSYEDDTDFDDEAGPSKRSRRGQTNDDKSNGYDARGKPIIPGERRSGRHSNPHPHAPIDVLSSAVSSPDSAAISSSAGLTGRSSAATSDQTEKGRGKSRMKGWAWVEEVVPFEKLSDKEKEQFLAERKAEAERKVNEEDSRMAGVAQSEEDVEINGKANHEGKEIDGNEKNDIDKETNDTFSNENEHNGNNAEISAAGSEAMDIDEDGGA
ncbi:hypothetical protein IAR55_002980 [Kwoniella newhampshirensis]|uniref:WHIM1 domain-containing protein n=1 Tax=Kwoniella newhampshirensis TaxID=1651941 RepID=A0AAW0YT23_9TREE